MNDETLDALVVRMKCGEIELTGQILDKIAREVYRQPQLYGMQSEDEVGEVMARYWPRIAGLVDRYEDTGSKFETFLTSTIKFMAMSVRRKVARDYDREAVFVEDAKQNLGVDVEAIEPRRSPARNGLRAIGFPHSSDRGIAAMAFRRRMVFLCVKCANVINDSEATMIASEMGMNERDMMTLIWRARDRGLGVRPRTAARRRGRDAAWLRMMASTRRLARETDPTVRRLLQAGIDRDRQLYRHAVGHIAKAKPIISNKDVAAMLGIPKGTVDGGVGRLLQQCSPLYL